MNQPYDLDRVLERCAEAISLDEFTRLLRAVPADLWPTFAARMNTAVILFPTNPFPDASPGPSLVTDNPLRAQMLAEAKRTAFDREHQRRTQT